MLFLAAGVLMYQFWAWKSALLLLVAGLVLSFFVTRRTAVVRIVLPQGTGQLDQFRTRWTQVGVPILAGVAGLVAPTLTNSGSAEGNPLVFLVSLLGIAVVIPQIILGVRLWRS